MARPWSPAEVEAKIPVLMERIEEALTGLHDLGVRAAQSEWRYRKERAKAYIRADGRNAEHRESIALLSQIKDQPGTTVADLGLAKDLAANAYAEQRKIIDALETEAKLAQTLHVSARGIDGPNRRSA